MAETETAQVENVEQVAPVTQEAPAEKVEVVANGDHKTENGNGTCEHAETPANGEAPNAESTPIKKSKRRAIVANMRAAFQRLDLINQIRAFGRRMRRTPKQKQQQQAEQTPAAAEEKPQENGLVDGAALLATTQAADEAPKCNGNGHVANGDAALATECAAGETSATVVETQNNDTTEQNAVVAH